MKLYRWHLSEALKRYSCGDIIVMAASVEQARQLAHERFLEWIKTEDSSWSYLFNSDGSLDAEWEEEITQKISEFKKDLEREPLDTCGTIFIMGSE